MTVVPRTGFFVPDGSHPRLAALDMALFDDKGSQVGMQIRNLLNDDTPDEELPPPLHMQDGDWFGGGDAGSVTTEDESDAPKHKVSKSPPRRQEHPQPTRAVWDMRDVAERRYNYEPHVYGRQPLPPQAQQHHYPASYPPLPPGDRYAMEGRSPQISWQPSSSYPPQYGPPVPPSGDYYSHHRASMEIQQQHDPRGASVYHARPDYFSAAVQKPQYDRGYQVRPAYPPPGAYGEPQLQQRQAPPHQPWSR